MKVPKIWAFFFISVIFLSLTACSQNEADKQYQQQALSTPSGIEARDANGAAPEGGETDSNDWRISPMFSGLVQVTSAGYPNPVSYNSSFEIQLNILVIDALSSLSIYAFQRPSDVFAGTPLVLRQQLQPGLESFRIRPSQFSQSSSTGTIANIYRIIAYDGQNNIITYGDVLVQ